jgi:ubiquinone/menaquinone biosynthesis C-methylase UbiE
MADERRFHHHHKDHLDSEDRLRMLNPDMLVAFLPLTPGDTWADVGCGTGTLTIPLARALRSGYVVALDVQPEMVTHTQERVRAERLANVEVKLSEELHLPLDGQSVDGILAAFVLHETASQANLLAECRRVLKPGGHLVVLEFLKGVGGDGPPEAMRISPENAAVLLREAGFDPGPARRQSETVYLFIARNTPAV